MKSRLVLAALVFAAPAIGRSADAPPPAAPAASPAAAPEGAGFYVYLEKGGQKEKVPFFSEKAGETVIASVGGDPVMLAELTEMLGSLHETRTATAQSGTSQFKEVLDRMITARLVAGEAREMGLDEQPVTVTAFRQFREGALRELVKRRALKDVKADPAKVEKLYRQATREFQIRSILFKKESDAKAFAAELKAGKAFEPLAKAAVDAKTAKGGDQSQFVPAGKMLPELVAALEKTKAGGVAGPLKVSEGWTLLKLEGQRQGQDARVRAEIEANVLSNARSEGLRAYGKKLVAQHAKVDKALLKKLDFDAAKPGIASYQKDKRVLARIDGEEPITVGVFATAVEQQFFHGVETAQKKKKVNKKKQEVLDALLSRRLLAREAKLANLEASPELKRMVADYEEGYLFSAYIEKAVAPDVKVTGQETKDYYEKHKAEYTLPAFYRLNAVAFAQAKDAQAALKKVQGGTDLKWLKANADGQVKDSEAALRLNGDVVTAKSLPPELANAIAGAKNGDFRLYAHQGQQHYVVQVADVVPAQTQAFEDVKDAITKKLIGDKLNKAVADLGQKLRQARKVEVYITRIGS